MLVTGTIAEHNRIENSSDIIFPLIIQKITAAERGLLVRILHTNSTYNVHSGCIPKCATKLLILLIFFVF